MNNFGVKGEQQPEGTYVNVWKKRRHGQKGGHNMMKFDGFL